MPEPGLVSGVAAELVSELGCSTAEELELGLLEALFEELELKRMELGGLNMIEKRLQL